MGALTNALRTAMTRKHVPESGDTALSTRSMGTSAKALAIVAKGNREGAHAMVLATNMIGRTRHTQAATAEVAKKAGSVKAWADQMEMLKSTVEGMAKDYTRGTVHQVSMAKTLAKTGQTVGMLNSGAQYDMYKQHHAAGMQIAVNQSAYGGTGWSA